MANFTPQEIEEMLREFFDTVGKRQYIGARYVPIFGRKDETSITWDNSKPYEPLTIVLYQGNSYTSRQYVPAGVDLDDTDYWALTGNYNAQVEAYRQEVANLDNAVDGIADSLPASEFDAENTVKEYIDTANTILSTNIDAIATLLPADEFSTDNTVFNALKDVADKSNSMLIRGYQAAPSAVLVTCKDVNILCDTGGLSDAPHFSTFLAATLGNKKLNCVILSHYDSDHIGGFATAAQYCDENTKVFVEMMPDENASYYNAYNNAKNSVASICANNNLSAPLIPADGQVFTFGDTTVQIWNTDISNRYRYEQQPSCDLNGIAGDSGNVFSLISRIEFLENSFVYTGDLDIAAQKIYANRMTKCSAYLNPHHVWGNPWGYFDFFQALGLETANLSTCNVGTFDDNYDFIGMNPSKTVHVPLTYGYLYKLVFGDYLKREPYVIGLTGDFELRIFKGIAIPVEVDTLTDYKITYINAVGFAAPNENYILDARYSNGDVHWPVYTLTLQQLIENAYHNDKYVIARWNNNAFKTATFYNELISYGIKAGSPADAVEGIAKLLQSQGIYFTWETTYNRAPCEGFSVFYDSTLHSCDYRANLSKRHHTYIFADDVTTDQTANLKTLMGTSLFNSMMRHKFIGLQVREGANNGLVLAKQQSYSDTYGFLSQSTHSGYYSQSNLTHLMRYTIGSDGTWSIAAKKISDGSDDSSLFSAVQIHTLTWWN